MTLHELLDKAGLNARTLRHWTQKGLMPRTTDGLYTETHLIRALAICRMRYDDGVRQGASEEARSLARKIATLSDVDASFD